MKTFLYVKTHNVTGLRYFGKTTRDPFKYKGSGVYWKRHLAKYGDDISTEVVGEFEDQALLTQFALEFSERNDIVNSSGWANLIDENGLDGKPAGSPGHVFTEEQVAQIATASRLSWENPQRRIDHSQAQKDSWTPERRSDRMEYMGKFWTEERKAAHSQRMKEKWADPEFRSTAFDISSVANTAEHNARISAGLKGKAKSEAHKKAMSDSMKAKAPTKLPEGVVWLEPGEYECCGIRIHRVNRVKWESQMGDEYVHGSLSKVAEAINNKFLAKQKD